MVKALRSCCGLSPCVLALILTSHTPAAASQQAIAPLPSAAQPAPAAAPANTWSPDDIAAAKTECASLLKGLDLDFSYLAPIKQGQCGAPQPIELRAFGSDPRVTIDPPATLDCKMAATLTHWFASTLQPLANTWLKSKVTVIRNAASYDCRNRIGDPTARLSEHAKANAIDIVSFTTAAGATVAVGAGWGPTLRGLLAAPASSAAPQVAAAGGFKTAVEPAIAASAQPELAALAAKLHKGSDAIRQARLAEAAKRGIAVPKPATPEAVFLHAAHDTACNIFGTVLGPEANDAHKDHFHLDMTARAGSAYCQ